MFALGCWPISQSSQNFILLVLFEPIKGLIDSFGGAEKVMLYIFVHCRQFVSAISNRGLVQTGTASVTVRRLCLCKAARGPEDRREVKEVRELWECRLQLSTPHWGCSQLWIEQYWSGGRKRQEEQCAPDAVVNNHPHRKGTLWPKN